MVLPVVNDGTFPFFGYSIKMTCLKKHHGKFLRFLFIYVQVR